MPLYRAVADFKIDIEGSKASDVVAEIRELFIKERRES